MSRPISTRSKEQALAPLLTFLQRWDRPTDEEIQQIEALPTRLQSFQRGDELIRQHSKPTESCLLVDGFGARMLHLREGQRQIAALHVPGDFVDLHGLLLKLMDHSVVAMSPCSAVFVPHAAILELIDGSSRLARLLWKYTVTDAAIQRSWIGSLGRRPAVQHLAHLVCELYLRLEAVGLAENNRMTIPITQSDLSDILGLSTVHVNRVLQELRRTGLITWERSDVGISDPRKLTEFADFDPLYLNLDTVPAGWPS